MSPSANQAIDTPPRAPSPVHAFGTLAVHAGGPHDPVTGAVIESVICATMLANHFKDADNTSRYPSLQLSLRQLLVSLLEHTNMSEVQIPTGEPSFI
jgi:hypothetical protein